MSSFLTKFNKYSSDNDPLIKKALSSATGVGEALIPQLLEKEITNIIVRLSRELSLMTKKKVSGKLYEFNQLNSLPGIGSAVGEVATVGSKNSTTARKNVLLKVLKRVSQVSIFLQDSSEGYLDAFAYETQNIIIAQIYDLINYIIYGNATSNPYEFDGLDTLIATNRSNEVRYGLTPSTLNFLDAMIDANLERQGDMHRKAFVMSPQFASYVSRLLTNVRLQQGIAPGQGELHISGGYMMEEYRGVPIIRSSSMRPKQTMTTITPSTANSGGTITDATYYFKVAPITLNGEELASAEVSQVCGGGAGNSSTLTLSWTPFAGAYRYKIYCSTSTNTEKLVAIIPAWVYDVNGQIVSTVSTQTLNGKLLTSDSSGNTLSVKWTTTPTTAGSEVATGMANDIPYEQDTIGGHDVPETVILWDMDEIQGLGGVVYTNAGGSAMDGLISIQELPQIQDLRQIMARSYCTLVPSWEATSYMKRGLRTF